MTVGGRRDNHGRVLAMGLSFATPLGVAAGVDRNGEKVASLDLAGFGHIEIGSIMAGDTIRLAGRSKTLRIGVNIGSSRPGMDEKVIADYIAALRQAYRHADYLCANLTSPRGGRSGDCHGVDILIRRLKTERDRCASETGRRAPLLIKIDGGQQGAPFPKSILAVQRQELDGIVLVCSCLQRIAAIKRHADSLTLISVGGVRTASQARERINAGADLVQAHKAFAEGRLDDLRWAGDEAAARLDNAPSD